MPKKQANYRLKPVINYALRNMFSLDVQGYYGDQDGYADFSIEFENPRWLLIIKEMAAAIEKAQYEESTTPKIKDFVELMPKRYQQLWRHLNLSEDWPYNEWFNQRMQLEVWDVYFYDSEGIKFRVLDIEQYTPIVEIS